MQDSRKYVITIALTITDIIAIFVSYAFANKIKFGWFRTGILNQDTAYISLLIIIIASYLISVIIINCHSEFLIRNSSKEFINIVYIKMLEEGLVLAYMYFTKTSEKYSREHLLWYIVLSSIIIFGARILLKLYITKVFKQFAGAEKIVLVTTKNRAEDIIEKTKTSENWYFIISSIIIVDCDMKDKYINGIEVIGNKDNIREIVANEQIDSLLVCVDKNEQPIDDMVSIFCRMGKKVHVYVDEYDISGQIKDVGMLGNCAVVTFGAAYYNHIYRFIKRLIDVSVSLCLCVVTIIVAIIISICHLIERDAGHTIIYNNKIGRNGRRYYCYKFRTMYLKEERRKGKGNFSTTGKIINKLKIENLPVVYNVLIGDLSIIGGYSPSVAEYIGYTNIKRKTLLVRPGLIGYKKRNKSNEECDLEYVENYTIWLDIEVLAHILIGKIRINRSKNSKYNELMQMKYIEDREKPIKINLVKRTATGSLFVLCKRIFDIIFSLIGLIIGSPIFLITCILVKWQDGGHIFYKHIRIGYNGKKFSMIKFRTMRENIRNLKYFLTDEQYNQLKVEYKILNDPRITKLGRFLRETSIDELPQLWNVLKGDMSLIGPRPIVEDELKYYGDDIDKLLSIKPGITGYWAAFERNNVSYESGERQKMELYYVDNMSILLDFKIILYTIKAVIGKTGK